MAENTLEGLWYIIAEDETKTRYPVLGRVVDDTYLLAFSSAAKARTFIQQMKIEGADVGMIVRGNLEDIRATMRQYGAIGAVVDFDPETRSFASTRAA